MRNTGSWMRRKWVWLVGGAFISVHAGTWLMQRAVRSAVHSEVTQQKQAEGQDLPAPTHPPSKSPEDDL
ncbi:uncharacterized protein [Nerophis lumbriciformis]|uniref:uncharacterized protein n=1 Tax=Nerophis lumbriciformis TaxID=546530 RepID=UPI003BA9F149